MKADTRLFGPPRRYQRKSNFELWAFDTEDKDGEIIQANFRSKDRERVATNDAPSPAGRPGRRDVSTCGAQPAG